jgi:hypothetical protein
MSTSLGPFVGTRDHPDWNPRLSLELERDGEWVSVPTVNDNEVEMRSLSGGLSLLRYGEFTVPESWGGESILPAIHGLSGESPRRQKARVHIRPNDGDIYQPVMFGFVGQVGGNPTPDTVRLAVYDFGHLLKNMAVSLSVDRRQNARHWLQMAVREIVSSQGVFDDLSITVRDDDGLVDPEDVGIEGKTVTVDRENGQTAVDRLILVKENELPPRQFRRDRDGILDVLEYIQTYTGTDIFFSANDDGGHPILVVTEDSTREFTDATHVGGGDGQVRTIESNAAYELSPQVNIAARGHTRRSLRATVDPTVSADTFPVAEARYRPLVERVGEENVPKPPQIDVDSTELAETEQRARDLLRSELEEISGGDVVLDVAGDAPAIRPGDKYVGVPVCGDRALSAVEPLEYSVQRVTHSLTTPTGDDTPFPQIRLGVGLWVDEDEVYIANSGMRDL